MEHRTRINNRLLAALPPADLDLLVPHFRTVPLSVTLCWCGRATNPADLFPPRRLDRLHHGYAERPNGGDRRGRQ